VLLSHFGVGSTLRRSLAPFAWRQRWRFVKDISGVVYREVLRTRIFDVAAGLAFFFLLSLVPLLMILAAVLSLLPIPNLFAQLLSMMAMLVPPDSTAMVERILVGILAPGHRSLLSFGIVSYLWSSIGGFTALISSLDIAYDVKRERAWWRDRLLALLLTFSSGILICISLLALVAGPHFGHFLSYMLPIPRSFARLWPLLRIVTLFVTFVAGLELVYFFAPNIHHRFAETLPGAVFAIAVWFLGSAILDFYLDHMANYSVTYGSLAATIGLMLWVYMISVAILIGGELNAELTKRKRAAVLTAAGSHPEPPRPRPQKPAA
jgi:membrane protein